MSWEVSSMQSKRSFFNRTLFRKNMGRFWPLWGGVTILGSLAPMYILLLLINGHGVSMDASEFAWSLYGVLTVFVPAATMCYAILCAMAVWGYLYSARSVGLMHTLPIDRTGLFVTNALSGLAMMLIPYAVVGGLLCAMALAWGFMDLVAVVSTAAAVVLMTVLFFGLATLCAMVTGHIFALPAFYLLFNFLAPALDALIGSFIQEFLLGVPGGYSGAADFLAPIFRIYQTFKMETISFGDGGLQVNIYGFGTVAAYGLAGLVLLAAAWAAYRARKSERAGDVVAFRWLRPVFRYGVALLFALTLGRLLYELLWGAIFQSGSRADLLPMGVCMAVTGVVGCYAASMLLEKSLRVFRGSWRSVAVVCAGVLALCLAIHVDVLGLERKVPGLEEIESVEIGGSDFYYTELSAGSDQELVEQVVALHQAVVDDREFIRSAGFGSGEAEWAYLNITYTLTDGSTLKRKYGLWLYEDRLEDPDTYDSQLVRLRGSTELMRRRLELKEGYVVRGAYVELSDGWGYRDLDETQAKALYEAILRDVDEGNFDRLIPFETSVPDYPCRIEIESSGRGVPLSIYTDSAIWLHPSMSHTIQALLEAGAVTPADVQRWVEDGYGEPEEMEAIREKLAQP